MFNCNFLVRQSFVSIQQINNPAIFEAMLQQVMLHDVVISVCVNPDIVGNFKTVIHGCGKNAVTVGRTGHTMNHVIGQGGVCPRSLIYI